MEVLNVRSPSQLEVPLTGGWGGLGQRTVLVQFGQSLFCVPECVFILQLEGKRCGAQTVYTQNVSSSEGTSEAKDCPPIQSVCLISSSSSKLGLPKVSYPPRIQPASCRSIRPIT